MNRLRRLDDTSKEQGGRGATASMYVPQPVGITVQPASRASETQSTASSTEPGYAATPAPNGVFGPSTTFKAPSLSRSAAGRSRFIVTFRLNHKGTKAQRRD